MQELSFMLTIVTQSNYGQNVKIECGKNIGFKLQ